MQTSSRKIISLWKFINAKAHVIAFAEDIGVKPLTVHAWIQRGSIPARYWPRIIGAASARRLHVTYAALAGETPIPQKQERAA